MARISNLKIVLTIMLAVFMAGAVFVFSRIQRHRSAELILNKMAAAYKNCQSYRDSGTAQLASERFSATLRFTTAFIRSDRFRYEYWYEDLNKTKMPEGKNHLIIWRKGQKVTFWCSIPSDLPAPKSFDLAIASAKGISIGTAYTIPALLFSKKEITGFAGWRLTDMAKAAQMEDAKIGNTDCFRLRGKLSDFNTVIWIDKETFLVRKMEQVNDRGVKIVTTYNPAVNVKIPDAALEFNVHP
jgi:outer membrane lipoprotein-sorting protein